MNVGGKRDTISLVMVVAGVIGALSLAGIFVVYLVDTIGGDGSSSGSTPARGTTLQAYRERGKEALFRSACRMVSAAGSPNRSPKM